MELSQEMLDALDVFRREWGNTEYEYYAIPVTYRMGKRGKCGDHWRPITGTEKYICSRDEYEQGKEQSRQIALQVFRGEYRKSYTDFQRRVKVAGWREKLIDYLKDEQP